MAEPRFDSQGRRLCAGTAKRTSATVRGGRTRGPCMGPAVTGYPNCRMHLGKSLEQVKAETHDLLVEHALEALGVHMDLLRDQDTPPNVRAQIARDLLDRAGFDAKQRLEVTLTDDVTRAVDELVADIARAATGTPTDSATDGADPAGS